MKGGKKKSEFAQALPSIDKDSNGVGGVTLGVDGATETEEEEAAAATATAEVEEEEEENEDEREEDEEGGEEGGEGEGGGEGERPKLDEGFYEIEDVRRKKVRKGQVLYLIKWRGWPESANTWEPFENLQSCSDIIEAFEESLRSGKTRSSSRSSRKRKRKYGGPHTQPKRKQRSAPDLAGADVMVMEEPLASSTLDSSSLADPPPPDRVEVGKGSEGKDAEKKQRDINNVEATVQPNDNGSANISLESILKKDAQEVDPKLNELQVTEEDEMNTGKLTIDFPDAKTSEEEGPTDGISKVDCVEPLQSNRFTGAKKRKSGNVRRFKQDLVTIESGDRVETLGIEDNESMGDGEGDKNKLDDATNPSSITKIIKPIGYSASISNNVQDVSITFVAMRSDGKEVVVDNKFLKINNPLLLISFYEQHLRYSPT